MKTSVLLLSFILVMGNVWAKKEDMKKGEWCKKELNLTDKQLSEVQEIRKTLKAEMVNSRKEFFSQKKAFREAMKDPKSTKDALEADFEKLLKSGETFQRNKFALMLKMREILTPEQMKKFHEFKRKHREQR